MPSTDEDHSLSVLGDLARCCAPAGSEGAALPEPSGAPLDEEEERRLAELFRALGHPVRVRILRVLLEKNMCIAGELAELVPLAPSTVSQHLKVLKEAGLIQGEVDGPRRCYCASPSGVALLGALLGRLAPG